MAIFKCKMCGGALEITEGITVAECEYCGTQQTVPTADNEKKMNLFTRANRLRAACEFDKAASIYESIVAEFSDEAEAYWGLVLCEYGIEYIDDPATGKKIPTCHRSSFESIMDDSDFEQVMEYADTIARKVYRDEAKQIEEIRKGIIAVSANEEPYDIFICYKETTENGDRTLDSVIAQDVYDELTDKGYRVFFSRITLEDKLGVEYEPYIFAALNSAKIMLVFGTDYEYLNAVWVKNEWSRFLKLMANDKTKHLIPCYKGVDAYDMPKEFAKLQAQDMGKVGATQDLMRGIEKLLPKSNNPVATPATVQTVVASANPSVDSYLKRVFIFLADGDFKSADEYCEKVLDIDPENAQAYLGKLMAELRVCKQEALKDRATPFDSSINYNKIKQYGDEDLISTLDGYVEYIKQNLIRVEQERVKVRNRLKPAQNLIVADDSCTIGIRTDGTLTVVGAGYMLRNTSDWKNIVAVSLGSEHAVGLKIDGTVVAAGDINGGRCNISGWTDIVAASAGSRHTVGVKSDGTVVAVGWDESGQCNVRGWTDIVAVAASYKHTVGLKSDGTVVAVGENKYGECNVNEWKGIVAISINYNLTIGLKSDGTVVAVGYNVLGQCNVSDWTDIVAISAGRNHTVGLKSDGTVVATKIKRIGNIQNDYGQCDVNEWTDIVAISAGNRHTVGLKFDGTVVAVGENKYGECNVSDLRLFTNIDSLEQEQKENKEKARTKLAEKVDWRNAGLCQHCGGAFKGLFTKKCANCGREKDY